MKKFNGRYKSSDRLRFGLPYGFEKRINYKHEHVIKEIKGYSD